MSESLKDIAKEQAVKGAIATAVAVVTVSIWSAIVDRVVARKYNR